MSERDFCYWLTGYFKLQEGTGEPTKLTEEQVTVIKQHLALVFQKVTVPLRIDPTIKYHV